jgi:hypothetical protein
VAVRSWGVAGAGVVALFLAAGVAFAAVSPGRLYSSALTKARAQRSVHYVASQSFAGKSVTITGDAAADRGVQQITYRKGGRVGHVTTRVIANTAYVRGDAFTLENYMGIPPSSATAWAGKWLSLASSAPDYKTVAAAVRLLSTIDELKMPPPYRSAGTLTVNGRRLVGVKSSFRRAGHTVSETLYIDTQRSLPVEQIGSSSGITVKSTFSRWHEAVSVSPPASAIPIR